MLPSCDSRRTRESCISILCLFLLLSVSFIAALSSSPSISYERRRCVLRPWTRSSSSSTTSNDSNKNRKIQLGWTLEKRIAGSECIKEVLVGWEDQDEASATRIELPQMDIRDSLASTIWPASFASSILCLSPTLQEFWKEDAYKDQQTILELGCGIGLTGLCASLSSSSKCRLTDNSDDVLMVLRNLIDTIKIEGDADPSRIQVANIDWRDDHTQDIAEHGKAKTILTTDVAYYYYLLRPLMDTAAAYMMPKQALWMNTGQANRESQWELYNNLIHGCYNQLTDEHEPAWPGRTKMLLYNLEMYGWKPQDGNINDDDEVLDGTIPIAVMLHERPGLSLPPLTEWDYCATKIDEQEMDMTF